MGFFRPLIRPQPPLFTQAQGSDWNDGGHPRRRRACELEMGDQPEAGPRALFESRLTWRSWRLGRPGTGIGGEIGREREGWIKGLRKRRAKKVKDKMSTQGE